MHENKSLMFRYKYAGLMLSLDLQIRQHYVITIIPGKGSIALQEAIRTFNILCQH